MLLHQSFFIPLLLEILSSCNCLSKNIQINKISEILTFSNLHHGLFVETITGYHVGGPLHASEEWPD